MLRQRIVKWVMVFVLVPGLLMISGVRQSDADSLFTFETFRDAVRKDSKFGGRTPPEEADLINDAWKAYILQQDGAFIPVVGQTALASAFPVSSLPTGTTADLTFFFVDTATGLPGSGPSVASVLYEVNIDPETPSVYTLLGTSFDVGSSFSFAYMVTDFEPVIRGTPFDSSGSPIIITGVDGFNVAVGSVVNIPIPEPSTLLLLGSAVLGLVAWRRVRMMFGREFQLPPCHGKWMLVLMLCSVVGVAKADVFRPSPDLPPFVSKYAAEQHQQYHVGLLSIEVFNVQHVGFDQSFPPPQNVGEMTEDIFNSTLLGDLVINGGAPQPFTASAAVKVDVTKAIGPPNSPLGTFDTEMIQLDVTGLPGGALIRESPTLPSLGLTNIVDAGGGMFQISSFFDIFTELSIDGGLTWNPATGPGRVVLVDAVPEPGTLSLLALGLGLAGYLRRCRVSEDPSRPLRVPAARRAA